MSKKVITTITVTIKVTRGTKHEKEWEDPDQYMENEVKDALMYIRNKYADYNQEDQGVTECGSTYEFKTT